MSVQAYILIETEPGKVKILVDELAKIKELTSACGITGPFDIIAYVEAKDIDNLGEIVVKKIQTLKGVRKTMSCLCTYRCPKCK
ncbi:MAG: Lrp/AsnC ligand binding domain-containing protein [Armatimonadetes bacterium]|nr:Lrp/AsnC ligand binding domain-containing protein [Armatimonadota bacterium]